MEHGVLRQRMSCLCRRFTHMHRPKPNLFRKPPMTNSTDHHHPRNRFLSLNRERPKHTQPQPWIKVIRVLLRYITKVQAGRLRRPTGRSRATFCSVSRTFQLGRHWLRTPTAVAHVAPRIPPCVADLVVHPPPKIKRISCAGSIQLAMC
jgi:hypothetical protein